MRTIFTYLRVPVSGTWAPLRCHRTSVNVSLRFKISSVGCALRELQMARPTFRRSQPRPLRKFKSTRPLFSRGRPQLQGVLGHYPRGWSQALQTSGSAQPIREDEIVNSTRSTLVGPWSRPRTPKATPRFYNRLVRSPTSEIVRSSSSISRSSLEKYLRSILIELGFPPFGPTLVYEDNKAAINMVNANWPTENFSAHRHSLCDLKKTTARRHRMLAHILGVINPSVGWYYQPQWMLKPSLSIGLCIPDTSLVRPILGHHGPNSVWTSIHKGYHGRIGQRLNFYSQRLPPQNYSWD
jgi:hypothetical protein